MEFNPTASSQAALKDIDTAFDGAGWYALSIELAQDADNSTLLSEKNGTLANVTLNRTMNAGGWNTFCAPFDISSSQITSAFGSGTKVKELDSSSYDEGTKELTLNFTEAENIATGKPYLVYLGRNYNVVNPMFKGVTISNSSTTTTTTYADFVPVMNPTLLTGGDKTVLFVTGGNKLTYPSADGNINGFRAYFQLKGDAAAEARAFNMSFDDETRIEGPTPTPSLVERGEIYDLSGRRVEKAVKGLYIVNGKKMMVK